MLEELRVENLLLIERANLTFGPGLTVLTGETGAGKTVLASALDLLLGGKSKGNLVRPGAKEAYVEGIFSVPTELQAQMPEQLGEYADFDQLVLARRVLPEGRTRAYIAGRSATVSELRDVATLLLSFYGQHEHRKLTLASTQLELLDSFCGDKHHTLLKEFQHTYAELSRTRSQLEHLQSNDSTRERELDILRYELNEIEAESLQEEELQALSSERELLRHSAGLTEAISNAMHSLTEDGNGVNYRLAVASDAVATAAEIDQKLKPLLKRLEVLAIESQDLSSELTNYLQGIELDPARLEQIEERMAVVQRLVRKYGGSITDVLKHAENAKKQLDQHQNADAEVEELKRQLQTISDTSQALANQISSNRRQRADELAAKVLKRLAELAMDGASFEIQFNQQHTELSASGFDQVDFILAPNPGVPATPLRETASGGELSRTMLALLGAANDGSNTTLIFDEIDAGIGGRTAKAVAKQLKELAKHRQILCITHLPQIAAAASGHFRIEKQTSGDITKTSVVALSSDSVVDELVRMLGSDLTDDAARSHAQDLIETAN